MMTYSNNRSRIVIGISACLRGEKVRFDGGHKRSAFCTDVLDHYFEFAPVCPEMALGLGTPRKSIRLMRDRTDISLGSADGQSDITDAMLSFSRNTMPELAHLSGYILCAKSPTCGMERVPLYKKDTNNAVKEGVGLFAKTLMETYPLLPVEEEGRLNDMLIRENFFSRVYAYHEWQQLQSTPPTKAMLMEFHSRYKYQLMAHCPQRYRQLGQHLANLSVSDESGIHDYFSLFMQTLSIKASRRNHTNVLQHIQGYFKKSLDKKQKQELSSIIMKYHQGLLPLLAPLTLINHYLREYPEPYIGRQTYLNPYPESLRLRYGY